MRRAAWYSGRASCAPATVLGLAALLPGTLGAGGPRTASAMAPAAAPLLPSLAFTGVTVIDVTTGARRADQTVVVVGNRIQTVGPARTVPVPAGAEVIDARGKYLIPGLWDMSTPHLSWSEAIRYGVTGVRWVTASLDPNFVTITKNRQVVLTGARVGPPRQINVYQYNFSETPDLAPATVVDRADSAKVLGFDMLEAGGADTKSFAVMAAAARRVGLRFGGELEDSTFSALDASDAGAGVIAHIWRASGGLDWRCVRNATPEYRTATLATCRQAAERLRRNGTWWVVPLTGSVMLSKADVAAALQPNARSQRIQANALAMIQSYAREADSMRRHRLRDSAGFAPAPTPDSPPDTAGILALAYRAGMPLLAGTDWAAPLLHAQLALMVSEGLSPLAALQAATLNPAKFLHATDSLGTVAPGKLADLVLLDADPLVDITNTLAIRAVVANGRYYDRAALDWM